MPVPSAPRQALARELARSLQGEVRFDPGSRALYATDGSNYRQVPIGVVIPKSKEDVIRAVEICRHHGAAVLPRGGGTSLCGQCCNVAVVIDFSKYLNRILEIDPATKSARVEPGVVLDDLRHAAERYGLTFAPDPATHNHNTLGGMIGNNSCGPHSVMGGKTSENVVELEVLTYGGRRMSVGANQADPEIFARLTELRSRWAEAIRSRFPDIPRRVSGYNLPALLPENGFNIAQALVGSEGTCVIVLEARVRLVDNPGARTLLVLGYEDVYTAGDHVTEIMKFGPIALEGIDERLISDMKMVHLHPGDEKLLPDGRGWLLVEFGGKDKQESDARAQAAMAALEGQKHPPAMHLYDDKAKEARVWELRESGLGATAHPPGKQLTWPGWEDSAVPPAHLGGYLRELRKLLEKYDYECDLYGHFGQGCVHTRIDFDLETAEGIATFRKFMHEAAELVTRMGGSLSGEHGDGQSKAELLPVMFGDELMQAFREFKKIWDPDDKLNPGKVIDAYRIDENLRLGTGFNPPKLETWFAYPEDGGDMGRTSLRCVGVGKCRKHDAGTMCPSYMATREEMHSTRGRARLLWEAMNGNVIRGWKDEHVKQALDLCLSCKGCKGECPVKVDMATYKAEYFAHYYKGRIRPLNAYAFGYIDKWSRLGSHLPGISSWLANSSLSKALLKIPGQRTLPHFAQHAFTHTFRGAGSGRRVILWPDTFNNYFHPEVAHAAAEALARAGCEVHVPSQPLCCGRPLYEFGLLDSARSYLKKILGNLHDDIQAGTPIVGLEPACVSVFKEELPNLLAHDEQAHRLSQQVHMLSDFLVHKAPAFPFGQVQRKAVVHGHCHHKSVLGMQAEEEVLRRLGLDFHVLDSGCCGMAGSFGFDEAKYDVSVACAERVLLPSIKELDADTLVMTNGFSCRAQIEELAGRRPLHLAEVLKMSL